MSNEHVKRYERVVELTVQHIEENRYNDPCRIVNDIHDELSDLLRMKMVTKAEIADLRIALNRSIYSLTNGAH